VRSSPSPTHPFGEDPLPASCRTGGTRHAGLTLHPPGYARSTYPLVNLSTRSQVEAKTKRESTRSAVLKVIQRDGVAGLYDGLSSSLVGIAVTNGIYYLCFEEARNLVLKSRKSSRATLSMLESIFVSAAAGASSVCAKSSAPGHVLTF